MHTTTFEEILELEELLAAKMDRIAALERMVADIRSRYSDMTDSQLREAIRDIRGTEQMLAEEKAWCEKTKTRIKAFYAPATKIA